MKKPLRLLLLGLGLLAGCARTGTSGVVSMEQSLRDAGFHVETAETREELAEMSSLPPHRIVPQLRDGETVYVFPDAAGCRCLYVGTAAEYAALKRSLDRRAVTEGRERAKKGDQGGNLDWGFRQPWF
jgi:hypothetical protein